MQRLVRAIRRFQALPAFPARPTAILAALARRLPPLRLRATPPSPAFHRVIGASEANVSAYPLLRRFSLLSAIALVPMTTMFVLGYGWHQTASLHKATEDHNVAMARLMANTMWSRHGYYLSVASKLSGDALRARAETAKIDAEIRDMLADLPVLKLKIYDRDATTIYSTEAAQMGESKVDSPSFKRVVTGNKTGSAVSHRAKFNAHSGTVRSVDLAETYVPIVDPAGKIDIILELYTNITAETANIRRDMFRVAAMTVALFAALYAILFLIVRRADLVLRAQREALISLNREIEAAGRETAALNAALSAKVGELERSNSALQDFARVASHDLQEPLRKIETFGSRLNAAYASLLPANGQMFLQRMLTASSRMRHLINDLLEYSNTGRTAAPSRCDLKQIANDVVDDLKINFDGAAGTIEISRLPTIEADPAEMAQLLRNLIANALKFRKPAVAPIIRLTSSRKCSAPGLAQADQVIIRIQDNGIGFDPGYKEQIFKIFQRLHGRGDYDGTGIGLATCRKIVERHHGTIVADARPGEGATFTITLPIKQPVATRGTQADRTQADRIQAVRTDAGREPAIPALAS